MRPAAKPRYVKPENVAIGDTIRVTYPPLNGIKTDMVGVVASREYQGSDRVLATAEGGELLRYNPARKPPTVTMLKRANVTAVTLPGFD